MRWRAFPLHPETPPAGQTLEELFAGQPVDIPVILKRLKQVARDLELPFGERRMTYNSRLAQELGKWAEDQSLGDAFHHAVFLAYFRDGENIGRPDILIQICQSIGLDPAEARQVLDQRTFRTAVDTDWDQSRRLDIRAVPTFVIGDARLVGAQPYEALEGLVERAGARHRI